MVGMLEEEGLVNFDDPVGLHINDLKNSAYGDITIENLMNMSSGLDCPDNYFDKETCYYEYSSAIGDGYWTEESPENPYIFVATLTPEKSSPQEQNISIQVLIRLFSDGLLKKNLIRLCKMLFQKKIWMKIGAEADGLMLAPRNWCAYYAWRFNCIRPRDAARVGLLFTPSYKKVSKFQN